MNARDYARIMKERGLIESPMSVDMLANAKVLQECIRRMKGRDYNSRYMMWHLTGNTVEQLVEIYSKQKEEYIRKAIKYAFVEEEAIKIHGTMYYQQIEFLKKNDRATLSVCAEQLPRMCELKG